VASNGLALGAASPPLRLSLGSDRAVMAGAVATAGAALQHASPELRADKELVLAAVAQDGWGDHLSLPKPLRVASTKAGNHCVTEAPSSCPVALALSASWLRPLKWFYSFFKHHSWCRYALEFASAQLRDDKDLVLAACAADCGASIFASRRLQADHDVIMAAKPVIERCTAARIANGRCT